MITRNSLQALRKNYPQGVNDQVFREYHMIRSDLLEYNFPEDLKSMSLDELDLLSYQIRDFLLEKVSKPGGI